jgi:hypothetical protein
VGVPFGHEEFRFLDIDLGICFINDVFNLIFSLPKNSIQFSNCGAIVSTSRFENSTLKPDCTDEQFSSTTNDKVVNGILGKIGFNVVPTGKK